MSLSHADQIAPKEIENGVMVPAGLQVGQMTLREHQDYLKWQKLQRPLTRREAINAGHRPKEVFEWFGDLDPPARETVVHLTNVKVEAYVDTPKVIEHQRFIAPPPQPNAAPTPLTVAVLDRPQAPLGSSAAHGEVATNLEGFRQLNEAVPTTSDQYATSVARGYTGDACPDCGSFTMIHNGTCLVCDNCGRTTGCS